MVGIVNGMDDAVWDPARDPLIPSAYGPGDLAGKRACKEGLLSELGLDPDPARPLIGCVSRLTAQKGWDLLVPLADELLRWDASWAVLGTGEPSLHEFFAGLARRRPDRVAVRLGYDDRLAHRIEAGADLFLMPSRYEPCGLNQLYSLKYGTVPVVRATGGLADTVTDFDPATGRGTGVTFGPATPEALRGALERALALYRDPAAWGRLVRNAMAAEFTWEAAAAAYEQVYAAARERAGTGAAARRRPGR